jgi:hypothetical protein
MIEQQRMNLDEAILLLIMAVMIVVFALATIKGYLIWSESMVQIKMPSELCFGGACP